METGTWPTTNVHVVSDLLQVHDKQMVARATRELRMAELVDELPRGIIEARDVVDDGFDIENAQPSIWTLTKKDYFGIDKTLRLQVHESD